MLDLYCERTGAGWWAEPWNLVSNSAFLLVAAAALAVPRRPRARDESTLAVLIAIIGLGSALFHGAPRPWTLWADVLPIVAFQIVYLHCYLRQALAWRAAPAALGLATFAAALALGSAWPALLNGSLAYLPAVLALATLATLSWPHRAGQLLALAAGLFMLSLTLRTLDPAVCPSWPRGTHWAWHVLNALVLALALRAYRCAHGADLARGERRQLTVHRDDA